METIFLRGPSLNIRLVIAIILSGTLMVLDHRLDSFGSARLFLNSMVSPIQYAANLPGAMLNWTSTNLTTQQQLLEENERLKRDNVLLSEKIQQNDFLRQENDHLRALLGSVSEQGVRKMIAEVMAIDNNPYSHQLVINKGSINGVYEGQAVLDEHGIVGQVLHVATTNSRILLISDITHAVPTRVLKNNVQLIVSGTGNLTELTLEHVAHSTDISGGDLLISSGLGNVFPEGYPVARITEVIRDESRPFAYVKASPIAKLDRLKYLLLLWPEAQPDATNSEEVQD
ncbi:rod shape-determining protein MreC [Planctobacterium marinum]|uniref:rod shape-determining protein MreC n=1 Tax=Planctobacterium marinum TaxID=1631968 RepID=UPI001E4F8978|nr:rod shape-determining protein MreC [Planctobacterium marinum]MCC2608033.1 rod shape-determining protein MreC [Planctobacterium marinum]